MDYITRFSIPLADDMILKHRPIFAYGQMKLEPGSLSDKALRYGLDGPGSLLLHVQTGAGAHSASYKMGTGGHSLRVKVSKYMTSHPTSS